MTKTIKIFWRSPISHPLSSNCDLVPLALPCYVLLPSLCCEAIWRGILTRRKTRDLLASTTRFQAANEGDGFVLFGWSFFTPHGWIDRQALCLHMLTYHLMMIYDLFWAIKQSIRQHMFIFFGGALNVAFESIFHDPQCFKLLCNKVYDIMWIYIVHYDMCIHVQSILEYSWI